MRWILIAALIAALGMAAAPAARAQAPAAAAAAAPNEKLAGDWEGTFTTDGPSGAMTLTLTKGSPWKVASALTGEVPPGSEPRDLVVDGGTATWKQTYGEYEVVFKGALSADGAQVTGTLEANQGGSYVGGGTFTLKRKG